MHTLAFPSPKDESKSSSPDDSLSCTPRMPSNNVHLSAVEQGEGRVGGRCGGVTLLGGGGGGDVGKGTSTWLHRSGTNHISFYHMKREVDTVKVTETQAEREREREQEERGNRAR